MTESIDTPRLRVEGLTKQFGPTIVLDDVRFDVRAGAVHGLIGQNGAGKSTLVKILAGMYPDHRGTTVLDGHRAVLKSPRGARAEGIAVVHQEFSLVPEMTIAENLLLGREPGRWKYHAASIRREAELIVERSGIDVGHSVDTPVSDLSPAIRQRIEIVKALSNDLKVLVMDEPTARLAEAERDSFFAVVRNLASRGVGLVFISHYLEEVKALTDVVTVLRNGRVVVTQPTDQLSIAAMAELMLGEKVTERTNKRFTENDTPRPVAIEGVDLGFGPHLRHVSVQARQGEVVGIAGLVGSGRTRLCRILAGVTPPTCGSVLVDGAAVKFRNPRDAIARGVVLIPEDRKRQGLVLESPISANLTLMALRRHFGRNGFVSRKSVTSASRQVVSDLAVSPPNPDVLAATLSGGNQQKVVLGKAFQATPTVLIVDQPTAGVDVGTKRVIHDLLRERAAAGMAVLVVSDDIDELFAVSDRFVIMHRGTVLCERFAHELDHGQLVTLISSGASSDTGAGSGDTP
jgi:ribose transport system ATP-binding protein